MAWYFIETICMKYEISDPIFCEKWKARKVLSCLLNFLKIFIPPHPENRACYFMLIVSVWQFARNMTLFSVKKKTTVKKEKKESSFCLLNFPKICEGW